MISPETIKKLHELNCEDVARRLGLEVNMHQAHCFMHQDKRPSLAFKNNLWKCFACDKGGDAISLVEEKCNLSFVAFGKFFRTDWRIGYGLRIRTHDNL